MRRESGTSAGKMPTHVVHEDDLVVADLRVLGINGDDEFVAGLDGDLNTRIAH